MGERKIIGLVGYGGNILGFTRLSSVNSGISQTYIDGVKRNKTKYKEARGRGMGENDGRDIGVDKIACFIIIVIELGRMSCECDNNVMYMSCIYICM